MLPDTQRVENPREREGGASYYHLTVDSGLKSPATEETVLRIRIRIRIHRILLFLGFPDPDPNPLVRGIYPDPSIIMQK